MNFFRVCSLFVRAFFLHERSMNHSPKETFRQENRQCTMENSLLIHVGESDDFRFHFENGFFSKPIRHFLHVERSSKFLHSGCNETLSPRLSKRQINQASSIWVVFRRRVYSRFLMIGPPSRLYSWLMVLAHFE
mmetsp:Transcript_15349/g.31684  ORF Transcript_15349/g.31684 Transcript_15349/m.31684 type:complete len:134 (-) Transcript_15349:210-611(-)